MEIKRPKSASHDPDNDKTEKVKFRSNFFSRLDLFKFVQIWCQTHKTFLFFVTDAAAE